MNKRMKFDLFTYNDFFKSVRFIKYVNSIFFLKFILNDILYHTDTDIFASFIREMTLSSTGSILSNTDLSGLSTVGTCDIFVYQMRHRVM